MWKVFQLSVKGQEVVEKAQTAWTAAQQRVEKFLGADDAAAVLRIGDRLQDLSL